MEDLLLLIMVLQEKSERDIINFFRAIAGYYILYPAIAQNSIILCINIIEMINNLYIQYLLGFVHVYLLEFVVMYNAPLYNGIITLIKKYFKMP
jgi:hypothetical protein